MDFAHGKKKYFVARGQIVVALKVHPQILWYQSSQEMEQNSFPLDCGMHLVTLL